ncbi:arginine/serine-rich coiled-coil protein 2 isoform X1 [Monomorium pharaonis]|uniref:arginine/serine-rich coiled-coil protein 2 isoform X1 n=2 Tax=Monomorium pharaonis TaxID=307658 RepID=UPI00102E14C7|nr:arginine/serine-rich coiled-coil protein 2 isoform X1 [Monomorium pharaonis]
MDSLANYASDGDNSNNSDDAKTPPRGREEANRRASDANYDPVQMDMSEESNNNNSSRESSSERANSPMTAHSTFSSRTESSRALPSPSDQRRADHENHTSAKDDHRRGDRSDRSRHSLDKGRRYDDRRQRDNSSNHNRDRSRDRRNRDDDKRKTSKDEKSDDRERSDKDHHYRDDRRDRNRDRNDRDRDRREGRRDRSDRSERDRRHSRDDRTKDRYRDERSSYHKERDRTRSRSRSRDRAPPLPFRTMSYREEKGRNKLAQLEKLGIELKPPEGGDIMMPGGVQGEQYYNPLATATQGKYAEQIQKRKLLWANKSKQDDSNSTSTAASTANTWIGTTFTHDQDGKVTAKFKRLMGIKGDLPNAPGVGTKQPDILKKQEEMFNNMEQQYEVARATTHTQRGVGLGYATGGYQFPR